MASVVTNPRVTVSNGRDGFVAPHDASIVIVILELGYLYHELNLAHGEQPSALGLMNKAAEGPLMRCGAQSRKPA